MKNCFVVFLFAIAISGCANFQPRNGMTFQEFRQMSIKSMNGEPRLARRVGNYEIYQMPSSNRDLAPTNPIARALYDPNKDISYVFANGVLVDTITASQLNSYSPPSQTPNASLQAPIIQPNQVKSSKALDYVFGKKWSIGELNCNLNGGAYTVFSKSSGYVSTITGKTSSGFGNNFEYRPISDDTFIYFQVVLAKDNKFLSPYLSPNTPTAETTFTIKLINPKTIEKTMDMKMIDIEGALRGQARYTNKHEVSISHLCQ